VAAKITNQMLRFRHGRGGHRGGGYSQFSLASGKPLFSGLLRWTIDHHLEHRWIVLFALHLSRDELAQKGAEGLGILYSNLAEVLSTAEDAESLDDRLTKIRGNLVGYALFPAK
jgi:hypothetical protein